MTMPLDWPTIVARTLQHEGGFTDDPRDPGNWTGGAVNVGELKGTNFGISAAAYPHIDIRNLTRDGAIAIYFPDYFTGPGFDKFPGPLAYLLFDAGVNDGPGTAARWLQATAGVPQDSVIGPQTCAAVAGIPLASVTLGFISRWGQHYIDSRQWAVEGHGWMERLMLNAQYASQDLR